MALGLCHSTALPLLNSPSHSQWQLLRCLMLLVGMSTETIPNGVSPQIIFQIAANLRY